MKKALVALAILGFVAAGAAQAVGQEIPNETQEPEDVENETQEDENETEDEETDLDEINETEDEVNETEDEQSGQFQARLNVAINTLDAIEGLAPNEDARTGVQNALETLRQVQEDTGGAPGNIPDEVENETEEENESEEETGQRGPPEGQGPSGVPGEENSNRPGFVNRMLAGIFG